MGNLLYKLLWWLCFWQCSGENETTWQPSIPADMLKHCTSPTPCSLEVGPLIMACCSYRSCLYTWRVGADHSKEGCPRRWPSALGAPPHSAGPGVAQAMSFWHRAPASGSPLGKRSATCPNLALWPVIFEQKQDWEPWVWGVALYHIR